MPWLESTKRLLRRWFTSIPFFVILGLVLGLAIAIPLIPRPNVATITVSGIISGQSYADNVLDTLKRARDDNSIKAVVLQIDSPGGEVSVIEQIYLDVLRMREKKPVVVSIGRMAASGGYYIAVAANSIYAHATSQIGSIGAWVSLPSPERVNEDVLTTGLFKATGSSKQKVTGMLEVVRQEFTEVVMSQRGDRLRLTEEELSQAEIYLGIESLRYGLIDSIGTRTDAIEEAASLAGIRNYEVVDLSGSSPVLFFFFGSSDFDDLKAQPGLVPVYYYLHFESE